MKVILFMILICTPALARAEGLSLFTGFGAGSYPIGSARLGLGDWEFGYLTDSFLGFNKLFRTRRTYVAWGLGGNMRSESAGVYGAAGLETKTFAGFSLRGELNATASSNAFVRGQVTIGLGFHF
jgi:hypothetical protein